MLNEDLRGVSHLGFEEVKVRLALGWTRVLFLNLERTLFFGRVLTGFSPSDSESPLFSKKSLFIGTSRLLHLKFPSQYLMGFDLILNLNLNLVFHLIKTFHM
jgi:hypothetical protein